METQRQGQVVETYPSLAKVSATERARGRAGRRRHLPYVSSTSSAQDVPPPYSTQTVSFSRDPSHGASRCIDAWHSERRCTKADRHLAWITKLTLKVTKRHLLCLLLLWRRCREGPCVSSRCPSTTDRHPFWAWPGTTHHIRGERTYP